MGYFYLFMLPDRNTAFDLVSTKSEPNYKPSGKFYKIEQTILLKIKQGWLCANIAHLLNNSSKPDAILYLQNLGYTIDSHGVVYWINKQY